MSFYCKRVCGDPDFSIEEWNRKEKFRSSIIWSKKSILGYVWDIIRNLIVIGVVLAIYSSLYDSANTIIVSILILIYLSIINIGTVLSQSSSRSNLKSHLHTAEILKKLGQEETNEDKKDFEEAGFLIEKIEYKFILNSIFNSIIFIIVLFNLFDSL